MTKRDPERDELRARLTEHVERLERQVEEERARYERRRARVKRITLGLFPRS
jgi:hypothetical protein